MPTITPEKLKYGDEVRIITPARSLGMPWITPDFIKNATIQLESMGLRVTFGEHVYDINSYDSTRIEDRIADIHAAFMDTDVKMVLAGIGGFNSNQLLRYIDYDLIRKNPKILC
jgi:muramoyltetrapeptide carboxypeptidase